jgi:stage IV sporulation protein FB
MKRLLELGETEVWAHWTLIPAALFLTVTEGPRRLGLGLLALLLHETGHLLTARGLGHRVRSLELWPFGAALSVEGGTGGRGSLPVTLAGPLCGLAAAGMSLLLLRLVPQTGGVMEPFFLMNLTLSAVNLLPAEPLDGGRALSALLARPLGARRARRCTAWTGLLLGGALLALGVYGAFLGVGSESALLFAGFLLFSGIRAIWGEDRALEELIDRQASLRAGRPVEVREAALLGDRTAGEALRALRRGRYTLIRVVDGEGRMIGTLDEGALLQGLLRRGENITLRELVFSV